MSFLKFYKAKVSIIYIGPNNFHSFSQDDIITIVISLYLNDTDTTRSIHVFVPNWLLCPLSASDREFCSKERSTNKHVP